ncbi:MAG: lytic transglycosylase domain-containing protein [Solirubrobacteraceae bacterium]
MGLLHVILAAAAMTAPPPVNAPLPANATGYVDALTEVRPLARAAASEWDGNRPVPEPLELYALYGQRLSNELADDRALRRKVIPRLPERERGAVRDEAQALAGLGRLARGWPVQAKRAYTTGPAESAVKLWRYYGAAKRRFGVARSTLAAVNLLESSLNRLRSNSVAGAQGPMQFIPSTWAAYGLGGDIRDPRDAILGAANYLKANGAPRDNENALLRYNPSSLYVDAILRYERRMRSFAAFRFYYARSLFVRGKNGRVRLTGP